MTPIAEVQGLGFGILARLIGVPLLQVTPLITELGRTRMEVNTKVKAGFSNKLFALNVVCSCPGREP